MKRLVFLSAVLVLALGAFAGELGEAPQASTVKRSASAGIHKIRHVVVIMQENRSFDSYFGTFPGADGIPPNVCVPDPRGGCVRPYHDPRDRNFGGPHALVNARRDIDKGAMNGFVRSALRSMTRCRDRNDPYCARHGEGKDVMSYHDSREIPNYWAYARHFVLQDHMFEPSRSWSLSAHLFTVSEWAATCSVRGDPMSCVDTPNPPAQMWDLRSPIGHKLPSYAWTDLTYLLHKHGVSWRYYVFKGRQPDCANDAAMTCKRVRQRAKTPSIWNPLPYFTTVRQDRQLRNITSLKHFFKAARTGTLPAVSWIVPNDRVSEHPPARVSRGQAYVTRLVNAIMRGPDWRSTAIFLVWDDWGGFYDHVVPPRIDVNGYGLRVPGLVISPYAKRGYIDHQTLSFDAYAKFIEDDFLGGQRLDPRTDGRPDPRTDVRENASILGNLVNDFNFKQKPRRPLILHPYSEKPAVKLQRRVP